MPDWWLACGDQRRLCDDVLYKYMFTLLTFTLDIYNVYIYI